MDLCMMSSTTALAKPGYALRPYFREANNAMTRQAPIDPR